MATESIFEAVKPDPQAVLRPKRYKSRFNPLMPPTGSTLGLKNCSMQVNFYNPDWKSLWKHFWSTLRS